MSPTGEAVKSCGELPQDNVWNVFVLKSWKRRIIPYDILLFFVLVKKKKSHFENLLPTFFSCLVLKLHLLWEYIKRICNSLPLTVLKYKVYSWWNDLSSQTLQNLPYILYVYKLKNQSYLFYFSFSATPPPLIMNAKVYDEWRHRLGHN